MKPTPPQLAKAQLDILWEDDDLLVINKPPWVLSVPGRLPEHQDSIAWAAEKRYGEIHVVHRLDCATSGVMVLAKVKSAQRELMRQFRDREPKKTYIAVGLGRPLLRQGEVQIPLITDWPNRPKQKIDLQNGKYCRTQFKVLRQNEDQCLVKLTPVTGRSHQLRLHMKALGAPIVGDRLYAPQSTAELCPRMLLHASHLQITHPQTGDLLSFSAPCDFFDSDSL